MRSSINSSLAILIAFRYADCFECSANCSIVAGRVEGRRPGYRRFYRSLLPVGCTQSLPKASANVWKGFVSIDPVGHLIHRLCYGWVRLFDVCFVMVAVC